MKTCKYQEKINDPKNYINWLKEQPIFSSGELDNLPNKAIIIHDSQIEEHLSLLKIGSRNFKILRIGATDPIILYQVFLTEYDDEIIITAGLPGISGISTQISELIALGIKNVIHIGTCGLLGSELNEGKYIISNSTYSGDSTSKIFERERFEPNLELFKFTEQYFLSRQEKIQVATGYTIPIFYYQPYSILSKLINESTNELLPRYIEMEQSYFFAITKEMNVRSLSMVVGSDRYLIDSEGKIEHNYYDMDMNTKKNELLKHGINILTSFSNRKEIYS